MGKITTWTIIFGLAGLGNLANGLWMLGDPQGWYTNLPAAVPDFGPMNEHFIRDLGCMFATWGIALIWAGVSPRVRIPLMGIQVIWFSAHALVHVFDTMRGFVGAEHWLIDFPLVYAPTLMNIVILVLLLKGRGGEVEP